MLPRAVANGLIVLIQASWKLVQTCQNTWRNHAQCSHMSSLPEIYKTGIQWLIFKLNLLLYDPYTNNMINSVVFWLNSAFSTILFLHFSAHSLSWCPVVQHRSLAYKIPCDSWWADSIPSFVSCLHPVIVPILRNILCYCLIYLCICPSLATGLVHFWISEHQWSASAASPFWGRVGWSGRRRFIVP